MLAELLGSFQTSATELMRQIESALEGGGLSAADEALHRLKGSALTLSFAGVADACDSLSLILRSDGAIGATEARAALARALRDSEVLLRDGRGEARAAAA